MPDEKQPEHKKFNSFKEFWPFYLSQHSDPRTRAVHIAGTSIGVIATVVAAAVVSPWLIPAGIAGIYSVLFPSHFIFEKNRPATLKNPFYSVLGDFRMAGMWFAGKLKDEYKKLGLDYTGKGKSAGPDKNSPSASGGGYGYDGPGHSAKPEGKPRCPLRGDFCPAAENDSGSECQPESECDHAPPPPEDRQPPGPGSHCS